MKAKVKWDIMGALHVQGLVGTSTGMGSVDVLVSLAANVRSVRWWFWAFLNNSRLLTIATYNELTQGASQRSAKFDAKLHSRNDTPVCDLELFLNNCRFHETSVRILLLQKGNANFDAKMHQNNDTTACDLELFWTIDHFIEQLLESNYWRSQWSANFDAEFATTVEEYRESTIKIHCVTRGYSTAVGMPAGDSECDAEHSHKRGLPLMAPCKN